MGNNLFMSSSPEVRYVDTNRSELIWRVQRVMVVTRMLLSMGKINVETYSQIRRAGTKQDRMRKLYEALDEGGDEIKSAFYSALKKCEPNLTYLEYGNKILQYKSSVIKEFTFVTKCTIPSDECVKLAACYIKPMIIQRSKEQTKKYYHDHMRSVDASGSIKSPPLLSNDKNQSIRIDQLFSPDCEGNIPKSVILSGDSGRGKSFTLQKIMLDWASGELYSENFDVIFLLHFDEVKCLSQKISLNELFSWSCSLTKDQISEILKLTPEKVLIFIDAIDEFSYDSHIKMSLPTNPSQEALPMDTLRSLMNGQILPESFLLVTTRSDADTVMNLLKGPQRFTEIEGFSERGVQEYFQNFFQDEELCRKTYESLKTNESLLTACSVPLLCWMVCFCLKKHFTDDDRVMRELKTNTSIYVHFVSTLLEYHDQSQSVLTMLLSLGHLAEEGMLDEEVSFNDETVYETGLDANSIPFLHKECRIQGFIRKRMLKFMHLSFQEFCIALFYMFLYEEESQRNIRDILAAERAKGRLSNFVASVLQFLCGLCNKDTSSPIFEKHNWTVPHIIRKEMESTILTLQDEDKLFALHCLYELCFSAQLPFVAVARLEFELREDTFELHSLQLELEAVEKQIQELLVRQTELRERRAALESSRLPCTLDAIFPDVLHSGAGTPRTLGAAAAEDASQAPAEDLAASGLRDLHPEPLRSPPRDGTRRCDRRRLHCPIPAILKDGESVGAIVLHAGGERHQAAADGGSEEGLQQPDRDGSQHVAHDEDHRVRTPSHVSTWARKDEEFVRRALGDWVSIDLSNVSLRSTDCWVLLYCLQCCPHIRYLNLMYCDLTAEKLKILQPVLCMCENMRFSVDHLSDVGDLLKTLCEFRLLRELRVQEDEYSGESPRWSLDLSVEQEDYLLSFSSSEENPSLPAVLNISFTCPQSEISSNDWAFFLQRLSEAEQFAEDSSALDEFVFLLLSSFYFGGLKKLNLKLVNLNESWASGIISLVQTCTSLQQLIIEEYSGYPRSLSSSFIISVYSEDIRFDMRHRQRTESLSKISLTFPCSAFNSSDWKILFQRFHEVSRYQQNSPECNEQADALFCFLHSVCDLKSVELIIFSLNQSWALRILTLIQACSSLQEIRVHATSLLLEVGLEFLYESLRDSHCTVIIEGPTISDSEPPGLDVQPLPVCQSCVHIVDSDQWVQVEPSVFTDEEGSEFRISTPAGRFECSRTRIRWVCVGDVTLQYRAVDGRFLSAELEKLQCEKIGPVIDVTVISGKLEEAHLPHYACLAESDRSLTESVKVLSVEDDGLTFESVELTRFHAKILQPYFSPKTVLMKLGISVKVHCDLLIFMTQKIPIILHVYFFPSDSLFKEKIKVEEKSSQPIKCPRPETPLRMMKRHSLEVPGASVQPEEIKLRGDIDPNFFKVKHPVGDDIKMSLSQVCDQKSVWTATIWKEELAEATACKVESSPFQPGKIQMKPQVSVNFDKVKFFDRNWSALIKSVENVNAIADKLLQEQVINEEMYSKITHPTSTKEESMREICSKVRKSSIAVKNLFISIIQEEEPSLLNELHLLDS
ncbi:NACHT, LRR and PYD domains-containing protein 1 homolog [Labeo rohita]|uniref:NACHT, LRR and PYD domains-containing protein 1 homolog n=1 Tax=Labeo rohita TaxID=84645 RepID=UPI0021E337E3|nr:NACHT, LRR and PYD domains-containing protein 1 homolog [Labeo rohita]